MEEMPMKRVGQIIGWSLVALLVLLIGLGGYIAWNSPGETAPIIDASGKPRSGSIATLEAIPVNGTRQWLLMRGQDRSKPVLLFLHGGPGLSEIPLLTGTELEKHFVVVNWEQRGAGKSYDADVFEPSPDRKPFTVGTFVEDAVAVSRWLCRRFRQPKIYLMAHSWGTFLGVLTVRRQPDLFHAFFSISQVARQLEAEQISYDWVLQQARERGAEAQVKRLLRQGRPPYRPEEWLPYLTWQRTLVAAYGGGMYKANFYPLFIRSILLCREFTLMDKIQYGLGAQQSTRLLWPAVVATDLIAVAPKLDVPYYLFQGIHDYQTPYRIARQYYDQVEAPRKALFTFTHSAHSPFLEEPNRFMAVIDSLMQPVLSRPGRPEMEGPVR